MDLHRHLAQFELRRNLFVWAAGDSVGQNFSFARRQRIKSLLKLGNILFPRARGAIALDSRLDGIEQLLLVQGLGKKIDGPGLDCLSGLSGSRHSHRD